MAKIPVVDDLIEKNLHGLSVSYGRMVLKIYLRVALLIVGKASPYLMKGLFHAAMGNREARMQAFLEGTKIWANDAKKLTKTTLLKFNEINIPEKGHLVFLNHVNEMDFPYDCYVVRKPFLANQVIKKAIFAYWWMTAMGSQVFDNSKAMSIAVSVRNLIDGLKTTSFIVYPEGHNSYSEEIKSLKKGMIKLAFDNKIPIYLVLKSGVASYQEIQKGNVVGYMGVGFYQPTDYTRWEDLQAVLQKDMEEKKSELDNLVSEYKQKNQT